MTTWGGFVDNVVGANASDVNDVGFAGMGTAHDANMASMNSMSGFGVIDDPMHVGNGEYVPQGGGMTADELATQQNAENVANKRTGHTVTSSHDVTVGEPPSSPARGGAVQMDYGMRVGMSMSGESIGGNDLVPEEPAVTVAKPSPADDLGLPRDANGNIQVDLDLGGNEAPELSSRQRANASRSAVKSDMDVPSGIGKAGKKLLGKVGGLVGLGAAFEASAAAEQIDKVNEAYANGEITQDEQTRANAAHGSMVVAGVAPGFAGPVIEEAANAATQDLPEELGVTTTREAAVEFSDAVVDEVAKMRQENSDLGRGRSGRNGRFDTRDLGETNSVNVTSANVAQNQSMEDLGPVMGA